MVMRAALIIFFVTTATTTANKLLERRYSSGTDDFNGYVVLSPNTGLNPKTFFKALDQVALPTHFLGNSYPSPRTAYQPEDRRLPATSYVVVNRDFGHQRDSYGVNINHRGESPIHGCRISNGLLPNPTYSWDRIFKRPHHPYIPFLDRYGYFINHAGYPSRMITYNENLYPFSYADSHRIGNIAQNGAYVHPQSHGLLAAAILPVNFGGETSFPYSGNEFWKHPYASLYTNWG